ncbi:MAG TPA: Crp/Fnr family transcriptional regulator [Gaiella sp.]|uniref:Crp/Fnr family transcriptional regulator n=1 Tax=Gaiella sp. TaxID=2663207 RepID=UPI002D80FF8E|nr:Crp/Fnr family transcriptional regulator [Gaiella sp.]HET9286540.1 Crp/Fnr family transcriptional regulator [Gaiella sp.]
MSTLFDDLAGMSAEGSALLANASVRRLAAGAEQPAEATDDASFLIVEEGFVIIRSTRVKTRGVVLCHAGAGALLPAPLPGETLHALVDARVTLVSEATYAGLLRYPALTAAVSDALRATLRQKQVSLANFASVRHVERVRGKLLQLAREHGRVATDSVRLDFPVTHDLLAEMIGSARETVSRAVDRLERSGFLVREGRTYRLLVQPDALFAP